MNNLYKLIYRSHLSMQIYSISIHIMAHAQRQHFDAINILQAQTDDHGEVDERFVLDNPYQMLEGQVADNRLGQVWALARGRRSADRRWPLEALLSGSLLASNRRRGM